MKVEDIDRSGGGPIRIVKNDPAVRVLRRIANKLEQEWDRGAISNDLTICTVTLILRQVAEEIEKGTK